MQINAPRSLSYRIQGFDTTAGVARLVGGKKVLNLTCLLSLFVCRFNSGHGGLQATNYVHARKLLRSDIVLL